MFYDIYLQLCHSVKKSPSAVAVEMGISKPTVNRWKKGSSPTDSTRIKIAEYFNISLDDMKQLEDHEKPATIELDVSEFSIEDLELLRKYKGLDEATKDVVRRIIATTNKLA